MDRFDRLYSPNSWEFRSELPSFLPCEEAYRQERGRDRERERGGIGNCVSFFGTLKFYERESNYASLNRSVSLARSLSLSLSMSLRLCASIIHMLLLPLLLPLPLLLLVLHLEP